MISIVRILFFIALLVSGWLTYQSITASVGCSAGGDCSSVVTSQWSVVLGLPIALVGTLIYLTVIIITFCRPFHDRLVGNIAGALCMLVVGAAVWFTALQVFIIKSFCPYCCVIHALATIGALLFLFLLAKRSERPWNPAFPMGVSFLLLCALVIIQFFSPASSRAMTTSTMDHRHGQPEPSVVFTAAPLKLVGGTITPSTTLPTRIIGDPSARPVHLVLLSDWTCEYCRSLSVLISDLKAPEGIAFHLTSLPFYHTAEGKAMHEAMLRLRSSSPELYDVISTEVMHGALTAHHVTVQDRIEELNFPVSDHAEESPVESIKEALEIAQKQFLHNKESLHLETVPQLCTPTTILSGNPSSEELQKFLEKAITQSQ